MVMSPLKALVYNLATGFTAIVWVVSSIIILYEKYNINAWTYATGFNPLIVMFSLLIFFVVLAIYGLVMDLTVRGCLSWHRDSLGGFIQSIVILVCLLTTTINLKNYITDYE